MEDVLIVFAKSPAPERSKTRLIPALGAEGAAALHRRMVHHTLAWVRQWTRPERTQAIVAFTGCSPVAMSAEFGADLVYREQGNGDLGDRLDRHTRRAFDEGTRRVVVVGTDCPDLSGDMADRAFALLHEHDVVLGPAEDGGYYLIGLTAPRSSLFTGISWGTDQVLRQTLEIARRHALSIALLPTLSDVDRPSDLPVWERAVQGTSPTVGPPKISIIIPTWNAEPLLDATLPEIAKFDAIEILLVAAGQTETSLHQAVRHRCQFLQSPPGRGRQMNAGARLAGGKLLLFLHADTRLPATFPTVIEDLLEQKGVAAGAFSLAIDAPGPSYRLIEWGTACRSRWRQRPYGDQTLFLKRTTFEAVGGFRELPIMEDYELTTRLRGLGRIAISPLSVRTSARRWQTLGPARTTLINQCVLLGYHLGVPCERLARWYRGRT